MPIDPRNDPHAHIVIQPLPSQLRKSRASSDTAPSGEASARTRASVQVDGTFVRAESKGRDPFIRAENEDDDGYDPYSDRPAPREPLFQEDPWA